MDVVAERLRHEVAVANIGGELFDNGCGRLLVVCGVDDEVEPGAADGQGQRGDIKPVLLYGRY